MPVDNSFPDPLLPPIEVVRPGFQRGIYRAVIFDFDGTLSLLRRNWQDVMIPMMVDHLRATGTSETDQQLYELVREFVTRLTGRQTIYQMIQLADEVKNRGVKPLEPLQYKRQYYDLLGNHIGDRVEAVRCGGESPLEHLVPGSVSLLQQLSRHDIPMYLASGTDLPFVRDEATVLKIDLFFVDRIYGALDEYKTFSKAKVIQQVIRDTGISGEQVLGIGDGYVEIEEVKKVGGLAIGVASDESHRGCIDGWKRERLIEAGADIIVADYQKLDDLLELIGMK